MVNPIVQVNVSQQVAAAPSRLQQTGAIVTQGGTNTGPNSLSLITQPADLTPLLSSSKTLTSLTWSGGTVTGVTSGVHGWTVGDTVQAVIAGASPAGYNGTYAITISDSTTFTYLLASNPGSETTPGTVTLLSESELLAQVTEFYAQGSGVPVYVLELGEGTPLQGVTALTTWLTNNPGRMYAFLVPNEWDGITSFGTLITNNSSPSSKLYFVWNTSTGTYTNYGTSQKGGITIVPAPTAPTPFVTAAALFWKILSYNPNSANQVTKLGYSYLQSVTPWPAYGNNATLAALKNAGVNYISTGAEGGISNTILIGGTTLDKKSFNYWYSVDWLQIEADLMLSAAVINGSNNPLAPLIYNQAGINSLQDVLTGVCQTGVAYGLGVGPIVQTQLPTATFVQNFQAGLYLGQIVVNADPFASYTQANPSDYAAGKYGGFSVIWIPAQGFDQIIVNILATQIV